MHERIKYAIRYLTNIDIYNENLVRGSVKFLYDIIEKYDNLHKQRKEKNNIFYVFYDKLDKNSKTIFFEELLKRGILYNLINSNEMDFIYKYIVDKEDENMFLKSILQECDDILNNYLILFFKTFVITNTYSNINIEKLKKMLYKIKDNRELKDKLYHKNNYGENIFTAYICNYKIMKDLININNFIELIEFKTNFHEYDTILSSMAFRNSENQIKFRFNNDIYTDITCIEFLDFLNFKDLSKYFLKNSRNIHMLSYTDKVYLYKKIYRKYKETGKLEKYLKNIPFLQINKFLYEMRNYIIYLYNLNRMEIKKIDEKINILVYEKINDFEKLYNLNLPFDLVKCIFMYIST